MHVSAPDVQDLKLARLDSRFEGKRQAHSRLVNTSLG